jgi:hypothetical protein
LDAFGRRHHTPSTVKIAKAGKPAHVGASNAFRSVPPRPRNAELRAREYLTPADVEKLIAARSTGCCEHWDATRTPPTLLTSSRPVCNLSLSPNVFERRHAQLREARRVLD